MFARLPLDYERSAPQISSSLSNKTRGKMADIFPIKTNKSAYYFYSGSSRNYFLLKNTSSNIASNNIMPIFNLLGQ